MIEPAGALDARSSETRVMAGRSNVDRTFNVGDIKSVSAICAWLFSRVAELWFAALGFGVVEGFGCFENGDERSRVVGGIE